ncbi:MAG: oxygen-dependent coproporphyrinogen oxidase [Bacteroidales bacterium]|nr:oxygen-dependent coproporphyrinogen oxidase [Bacteroidales bacterium]
MMWEEIKEEFKNIQNHINNGLDTAAEQTYNEDLWDYEHGNGGGRTRVYTDGVLEKGGVNFSAVEGKLNPKIAQNMGQPANQVFKATGVSLVIHPRNPYIPTVHMNVRYFECGDSWWFGGGIDLTPYYPYKEDVIHFHSTLKKVCDQFDTNYYPRFKSWCDEYFYLPHRNETRGVGGVFFDQLSGDKKQIFEFVKAVGYAFNQAYIPLIEKRKVSPYVDRHRNFQLYRRGRYVEFNLVYDKGTLFGLETKGRIESILMSLPAQANWKYNWRPEPGSEEAQLDEYLKPHDWV